MPRKGILERLREGVVLGDGGYVLELERRGYVQAGPYTPEVVVEHPEALRQLHREFLRAQAAMYRLSRITDELEALVHTRSADA